MICSGGAHSAPSGFGGASPSFALSSGANIVNAIAAPLFDQVSALGGLVSSASRADWPVSIQRTNSCGRPSSCVDTYASRLPSGDQRGEEWEPAPVISGVCSPLVTSTSQIDRCSRSVMMSYETRVYATTAPSGRICGSAATCRENKSRPVNSRGGASGGAACRLPALARPAKTIINGRRMQRLRRPRQPRLTAYRPMTARQRCEAAGARRPAMRGECAA